MRSYQFFFVAQLLKKKMKRLLIVEHGGWAKFVSGRLEEKPIFASLALHNSVLFLALLSLLLDSLFLFCFLSLRKKKVVNLHASVLCLHFFSLSTSKETKWFGCRKLQKHIRVEKTSSYHCHYGGRNSVTFQLSVDKRSRSGPFSKRPQFWYIKILGICPCLIGVQITWASSAF